MPDIDPHRDYITTPEAAQRSGLSKIYLARLMREGTLEGFRLARDWFIYIDSLEKFLATPRKPGPKGPIGGRKRRVPERTRRRHGEGTVVLRKDGRWQADFSLGTDEATGKRKRLTRYGRTEEEAYAKLREALQELG